MLMKQQRDGRRNSEHLMTNNLAKKPEFLPIVLLTVICLLIGIATLKDYGESWDEASDLSYGQHALTAYQHFLQPVTFSGQDSVLNFYGPAYFMGLTLFTNFMTPFHPDWPQPTVWHLFYFFTFLVCILLLYLFLRRWISPGASFATCLLFTSQPLFWGHAFINPKDLPFMTFFLASVYFGFAMVDRYFSSQPNYLLIVSGSVMLGLTISFRSIGPLAGVFVAIYAISKSPRKSILLLISYSLLAFIISYLTWPFLWGAPIPRFIESITTMSKFPYLTKVLFMGHYYQGNGLPWFYYLVMLGIQLTEPMIPLIVVGAGLAIQQFMNNKEKARGPLLLFIGWFLLPAFAIIGSGSTLYDNGRQLFFLLPPIFLLIGLSIDALINMLHSQWLITGIIFLFLIPGIYASYKLHPYEYIYYNKFVSLTGGTYNEYEMDYWGTSYREVALWLNTHASTDATIWVTGPFNILETYLRPDLKVSCASEIDCGLHYDYVVALARWKAENRCRGANTVFSVTRNHAVLSVVKKLAPGHICK
jgi:hypothetical protein